MTKKESHLVIKDIVPGKKPRGLNSTFLSDTSGISSIGIPRSLFKSSLGSVSTLFHNDEYIEKLNQQLRYELGAMASYTRLIQGKKNADLFQKIMQAHQKASRELCCLITSHHGLPDKEAARLFKIAETFLEIYNQLTVGKRFLLISLANLEQHMTRRYQAIINIAPESDRHTLIELKRLSRKNRSSLRFVYKGRA
jgi:bacterioferritin (cytochrome b1)